MIILCFLLVTAVIQDIRSGRVSNKLVLFGLLVGLFSKVWEYDARGIYLFLRNISVPVILFYLLFLMHVLGAGDIKLFSMIGGILTIQELFLCVCYSVAAGGILSLLFIIADKHRRVKLKCAWNYLYSVCRYQKVMPYEPPEGIPESKMAFSLAIFLGWVLIYMIPLIKSGGLFWYN